jgi:hypothetical protein
LARSVGASTDDWAIQGADVVVVATGYADAVAALRGLGDLSGKVVVDITNPLTADFGDLTVGFNSSAAEEIQKAFPTAKVVKGFNTVFAQLLAAGPKVGGTQVPVYVAGDDGEAKRAVESLAAELGFKPVDAGPLRNARLLEPLALLNIYLGYGAGHGTAIAPAWLGL